MSFVLRGDSTFSGVQGMYMTAQLSLGGHTKGVAQGPFKEEPAARLQGVWLERASSCGLR